MSARIGIGRIERGVIRQNQPAMITNFHAGTTSKQTKIVSLYQIDGLTRIPVTEAKVGDIVCFSGAEISPSAIPSPRWPAPNRWSLSRSASPTMEMTFSVNDSPFAGREGKYVTSRKLRERLYRELLKDVSLRVTDGETTDSFKVAGRGEMHLSILIETMRREGYEMTCSMPHVLFREVDGKKQEPMEKVSLDVPCDYVGPVVEELGRRKGELLEMNPNSTGTRMRIEYMIPARCLIGYRAIFMNVTRGEGIINSVFAGYAPYRGDIALRYTGSLVASEDGETTSYGLYNTQDRGAMFIGPATPVYEGMIVGENPKGGDIAVNPCKKKQ